MTDLHRCAWAESDPLMRAYHDEEWGVPERDPRRLWEMLMLEGFQAGLAWIIVLRKREAFRKAFAGFDPKKVARFGKADIKRLMADAGIIRARAKIDATIRGAQIVGEMEERGESFGDFCWSSVRLSFTPGCRPSASSTTTPPGASGAIRSAIYRMPPLRTRKSTLSAIHFQSSG